MSSEQKFQIYVKIKIFKSTHLTLKDVRTFSREVFDKLESNQDLKDELVLAIAEAAQNIVKHAYNNEKTQNDKMLKMAKK